ncbi:DUF899 domain-containing protein [Sorangium sp. So ce260]|uniref:DUF899 domain-containing protein n=1 Tax=Sorangium sp. So ce260 TaxID=3133291 RepID=UPI003F644153
MSDIQRPALESLPPVVSQAEWRRARAELLEKEKAHTRAGDALAAARRRLPMVKVNGIYRFTGNDGEVGLLELFEGRRQLIIYHHMLKPADTSPCEGCCMVMDNICNLAHVNARDTTFAVVSRAPINEINALKQRMGWAFPWYSTTDRFNPDFGVTDGFGLTVFLREGDDVFHAYFTTDRGVESIGNVWSLLDLTPLGRQETWEDSPAGWPQTAPFTWWRLHDEYGPESRSESCCGEKSV